MIAALVYLQACLAQNRLRAWLRRLRQPKYLVSLGAAVAYVYFFFLRPVAGGAVAGAAVSGAAGLSPELLALVEAAAATVLLLVVSLSWLLPKRRAALDFSEAEIAFLFPAPVSRRRLVHFKLIKSQVAILVTALVMTLFTWRWVAAGHAWRQGVGWWLLMATINLHDLAASFTRTRLAERGLRPWQWRCLVLGVLGSVVLLTDWWGQRAWPTLSLDRLTDLPALREYATRLTTAGPLAILLPPFRWLVRPVLAPDLSGFLWAAGPVLALLAGHYAWVVRSAAAFEEASLERARERARMLAAVQAGNWGAVATLLSPRFCLGCGAVVLALVLAGSLGTAAPRWLPVVGVCAVLFAPMLSLIGPQLLTLDLRWDLTMADLIKTYPLPGWQVVLGEVLAPTVVVTAFQWGLIVLAVVLFPETGPHGGLAEATRVAWGLGSALCLPLLTLSGFLLANGLALLLPGWCRPATSPTLGFEAMGYGLLFFAAQVVALVLLLVAPALVFGLVYWLTHPWLGSILVVPAAAVPAAATLGGEIAAAVGMLGDLFDRLDSSVDPPA